MIKVDIISGFLGAGKTTLISKLIKERLSNEKVVLIENEFGEIGIDGGFLKESGVVINEMNSGCICCSLVGDFKKSLEEVIEKYSPERIIIEPSGVGKLSDITKIVKEINNLTINSCSTVVDAKKAKIYSKNFKEFFNDQIENAPCILLSKTSNLDDEKLKESVEIVKIINENARVVTTDWDSLSGSDLLNVMEKSVDLLVDYHCDCETHNHHHEDCNDECNCHTQKHVHCDCETHNHHHEDCNDECNCHTQETCTCGHHQHHAEDTFTSIGFETINKYSKEDLENILSNLDENIIRAKGIVKDKNDSWLFFDYVPNEFDIRNGTPTYTGLITVIGTKNIDKENIKKVFGIN